MSRDIAGSKTTSASEAPLLPELFQSSVYKPNQGRIVRQFTVLAIWIVVALGTWSLYSTLSGGADSNNAIAVGVPTALLLGGLWIGYRLINWPRFADFLIAVEAEMKKVTWPSKDEVKRASVVVILTILILAVSLFLFDIIWKAIFDALWATA